MLQNYRNLQIWNFSSTTWGFPREENQSFQMFIGNSATEVSTEGSSPTPAKWRRFRSISCSPALCTRNPLGHLKPPLQRGRPWKYADKFSPTKSGVSQLWVRFRGWLTRVQEIAQDRGLDFVKKRSRTKAYISSISLLIVILVSLEIKAPVCI